MSNLMMQNIPETIKESIPDAIKQLTDPKIDMTLRQQLEDWKKSLQESNQKLYNTLTATKILDAVYDDREETNGRIDDFFHSVRKAYQSAEIPDLIKNVDNDKKFFFDTAKVIVLTSLSGYPLIDADIKDSLSWASFFCPISQDYMLDDHKKMDLLSEFISGRLELGHGFIDDTMLALLADTLLDDYIYRKTKNKVMAEYKELEADYVLMLYKIYVATLASEIYIDICNIADKNEESGLENDSNTIDELQQQISQLERKYEYEKKRADAFFKSYERMGITLKTETDQTTQEQISSDEDKKQIARLNTTIIELERYNAKLIKRNKQLEGDRKGNKETLEKEEQHSDIGLYDDIDYNAKYAFILVTNQKFEIEDELKKQFPNSVIISNVNQVNNSIDLAVLMTNIISHSAYSTIKKKCKNLNIPYIHCPSMNISQIKGYIWNYYNS